ncbi:MAG TPA: hypothetical protein VFV50_02095 [Bdellovibrionales bacterium]|nr:hypothetical protein [Bdellovibrionales bacterium]
MNLKAVAGVLVALVIAILLFVFLRGRGTDPGDEKAAGEEQLVNLFHPDSVVGFQWKTKSKTHAFTRPDRNKPWSPDVNPQDVQERLNLLAVAPYKPIEAAGPDKVEVTVAFGENNQWTGAWDGTYFHWKEGNFKGQGFKPRTAHVVKFEAGQFAFEGEDLNWCPQRIKTLKVDSGSLEYTLRQDGLKWIVNDKEVDPTFVEQWFGRACSNKLEEYLDPEVAGDRELAGSLDVTFTDDKSIAWKKQNGGDAFFDGKNTFVSPTFAKHLEELAAAPAAGTVPAATAAPQAATPPPPSAEKESAKNNAKPGAKNKGKAKPSPKPAAKNR